MGHQLPDIQDGFRKDGGPGDHTVNLCWIKEKSQENQKNIYICFIGYKI